MEYPDLDNVQREVLESYLRYGLADFNEWRDRNKGKTRVKTDEEVAFELFAEDATAMLSVLNDATFARRIVEEDEEEDDDDDDDNEDEEFDGYSGYGDDDRWDDGESYDVFGYTNFQEVPEIDGDIDSDINVEGSDAEEKASSSFGDHLPAKDEDYSVFGALSSLQLEATGSTSTNPPSSGNLRCSNAACQRDLGPRRMGAYNMRCPGCSTMICSRCANPAHSVFSPCPSDTKEAGPSKRKVPFV